MANDPRRAFCPTISRACVIVLWIVAVLAYILLMYFLYGKVTDNLRSGSWLCKAINEISLRDAFIPLVGAKERLIWPALWSIIIILYTSVIVYSVRMCWNILQKPFNYVATIMVIAIGTGLALRSWTQMGKYEAIYDSESCPFTSEYRVVFAFAPYMCMIFRTIYEQQELANLYWDMTRIMACIHWFSVMLILFAGQSLLWPTRGISMLSSHMVALQSLILMSSGLFTLGILYSMNEIGWLAEIVKDKMLAEHIRSLQTGYVLYFGIMYSALICVFFGPLGIFLRQRARELMAAGEGSAEEVENWEKRHGLVLFTQGRVLQIGSMLAPLVTSVTAALIKSAFPISP